jgi:hypothetical protein
VVLTQLNAPQQLELVCEFNTTTNHKPSEDDVPVRQERPYTYFGMGRNTFLLYPFECARVFFFLCPDCPSFASAIMMDLTQCHQTTCHTEITKCHLLYFHKILGLTALLVSILHPNYEILCDSVCISARHGKWGAVPVNTGTRWRSWFRYCILVRKVAGPIPDENTYLIL